VNHGELSQCFKHDDSTINIVEVLLLLLRYKCIKYKIAVITQKALSTSVPPYIDELLQRQVMMWSLRSTDAPRLCAMDTHWDSQVIVLRSGCECHYRITLGAVSVDRWQPIRCQPSVPNWKHFFTVEYAWWHTHFHASKLTFCWHYQCDTNLFYIYISSILCCAVRLMF